MNNETDTPRTNVEIEDARNVALEYECGPRSDPKNCEVVVADFARSLERELNEAHDEITQLREIFPKVLAACSNGSVCSPAASVKFLTHIPEEVGAVVRSLKQQRDRLAAVLRTALEWIPQTMQRESRAALAEVEEKEGL